MYMTRGSLSTEHSTRRFGSDCPRRIIFAAFHVGSKRNCGGDWHSCVNTGCPFVVAVSERGVRLLLRRSFQSSAVHPKVPAHENVSPVTIFVTFHSPQQHPTDIPQSETSGRRRPRHGRIRSQLRWTKLHQVRSARQTSSRPLVKRQTRSWL